MTSLAFTGLVLVVFNLPPALLTWKLLRSVDLRQVLREKTPAGGPTDATSYSRLVGLMGATVLTSLFWALGDVVLYKSLTQISDIRPILDGVGPLFLAGVALFLPYAFNQVRSVFGAGLVAAPRAETTQPGGTAAALNLVVVNLSTTIDDAAFAAAVAAVSLQVSRDFQPEWGRGATLNARRLDLAGAQADVNGALDAVIYVGESASDPTLGMAGAYGYHAQTYGKLPYAFIYLDVCAQYGEAWSCTLSHEVLELLADPTTVLTVSGPAPTGVGGEGQTVAYVLEVCDPTQGDHYEIDQVTVANFVTRSYFGMTGAAAATNFLNLALSPFGVRPGGYVQYEDSAGPHQVNGDAVDARRLAARAMLAEHRRNARRTAGMGRRL